MAKNLGKNITVKFGKKIYKPEAVRRAVKEYSEHADISVRDKAGFLEVLIKNVPSSMSDELRGEFCNYALALMREV